MSTAAQVWIVEAHINRIRRLHPSARTETFIDGSPRYPHIFDTENDAINFMIARARNDLDRKCAEAKKARVQLERLLKKHGRFCELCRGSGTVTIMAGDAIWEDPCGCQLAKQSETRS